VGVFFDILYAPSSKVHHQRFLMASCTTQWLLEKVGIHAIRTD
jgi:hypothetical protein